MQIVLTQPGLGTALNRGVDTFRCGIENPRGNYSMLRGRINLADECCYPAKFRDVDSCFMSYVGTFPPESLRMLKKVRIGQRVDVQIQPLVRTSDGRPQLGPPYNRRVTLRSADAKLRGSKARETLERIGCLRP